MSSDKMREAFQKKTGQDMDFAIAHSARNGQGFMGERAYGFHMGWTSATQHIVERLRSDEAASVIAAGKWRAPAINQAKRIAESIIALITEDAK